MTQKMRVMCGSTALGYERLQGVYGYLVALPLPALGYDFAPDTESMVSIRGSHIANWVFVSSPGVAVSAAAPEPAGPKRRERDQYDEKQFERDLDEAIAQARQILWSTGVAQISFKQGETVETALSKVIPVLVQRMHAPADWDGFVESVFANARAMLLTKNAAYGDSALNPVRIFATASPMEQLLVRLDDKVSRLERGQAAGEDVANDLLGYLILVLIAKIREARG